MHITHRAQFVATHKTGELHPELDAERISQILGFPASSEDDPDKVTFIWDFWADGEACSIWDYRGKRWSTFGPERVFAALFGNYRAPTPPAENPRVLQTKTPVDPTWAREFALGSLARITKARRLARAPQTFDNSSLPLFGDAHKQKDLFR